MIFLSFFFEKKESYDGFVTAIYIYFFKVMNTISADYLRVIHQYHDSNIKYVCVIWL